ncbi:MAG: hypothetical protein GX564_08190 [Oligosphaeraceae bacterium]|nr:hypothetical protein [Oligosphaeraceae bacterium]
MDLEEARLGLSKHQQTFGVDYSTADFTPTLCGLWGLRPPTQSLGRAITAVQELGHSCFGAAGQLEKALVFCPDAIGDVLWEDYPGDFAPLTANSEVRIKCSTVMPSVTPVCFASIFSGAPPEIHGIQAYSKPVLTVETLFDVAAEAGKQVAIVSSNNCSIDKIFRDRKVDYFSLRNAEMSFEFTKLLLRNSDYDLIISYDGSYDSSLHKTGGRSGESLQAMRTSIARFVELAGLSDAIWGGFNRLLTFTPDHGGHDNPETGRGGHGTDVYDDMVVNHFYRLRQAQPKH